MDVWVGTKNKAKVASVQSVFTEARLLELEVSSGVSNQPFSDEETRLGAIHRATQSLPRNTDEYCISIGLEGGVMEIDNALYICNWGALATSTNELYVASGARIPLPKEIADELYAGNELGPVMEAFSKKADVRQQEGAIGIFTNGLLDRSDMFSHIVRILKGQWEYNKQK